MSRLEEQHMQKLDKTQKQMVGTISELYSQVAVLYGMPDDKQKDYAKFLGDQLTELLNTIIK